MQTFQFNPSPERRMLIASWEEAVQELDKDELILLVTYQQVMISEIIDDPCVGVLIPTNQPYTDMLTKAADIQMRMVMRASEILDKKTEEN